MIAKKLADKLGMELEIHKVEWDSIGISMDSGEYDCIIAGMGRTAERQLSYSFTEPNYYRDNCIVVKKGSAIENITGLSQLAGKNVTATTQLGTGWVPLLNQIPDVKLGANYETTAEVFMALSNGTADVAVIDVPTAESALLTNIDLKAIPHNSKCAGCAGLALQVLRFFRQTIQRIRSVASQLWQGTAPVKDF